MILKIDTTKTEETKVSLCKFKGQEIDQIIEVQKKGSQVLLPMIDRILKRNKIKLKEISSIEVNCGPGSFTGTRVGVSVANALGFALNLPVNGKKGKIAKVVYEKSKFDL